MSTQGLLFDWKQVDEKLASLIIPKLATKFGKNNHEDFLQIHFLNMGSRKWYDGPLTAV